MNEISEIVKVHHKIKRCISLRTVLLIDDYNQKRVAYKGNLLKRCFRTRFQAVVLIRNSLYDYSPIALLYVYILHTNTQSIVSISLLIKKKTDRIVIGVLTKSNYLS